MNARRFQYTSGGVISLDGIRFVSFMAQPSLRHRSGPMHPANRPRVFRPQAVHDVSRTRPQLSCDDRGRVPFLAYFLSIWLPLMLSAVFLSPLMLPLLMLPPLMLSWPVLVDEPQPTTARPKPRHTTAPKT